MNPARKRRLRLVIALSVTVLLAGALVYTSFSGSTEAATPSQIKSSSEAGQSYKLTGKVVPRTIEHRGEELHFRIRDRKGTESVPVVYSGVVPDPFRENREVLITGKLDGNTFQGERDSLVTKCPSKFTEKKNT